VEIKNGMIHRVKYWEIIADKLSKTGWSWGCVSAIARAIRRANDSAFTVCAS
jgi:hypothetical protein